MTKRVAFRLVTLLLAAGIGLALVELVLRWRQSAVQGSDEPDPGLVRYDPQLGWQLTPGWRGGHRHHDFDVRYAIDDLGFRVDPARPRERRGKVVAVVGDSFTFGLGVNDGETFVSALNQRGTNTFLNLSMPGYSTDQEALLIEREVLKRHPDELLLVVYVGNDLLDNQFSRPIQFAATKPYFELTTNGLTLRNVPVPAVADPARAAPPDLATVVLGSTNRNSGLVPALTRRFTIARLVSEELLPAPDYSRVFAARFGPAIDLFGAILVRINQECTVAGTRLTVLVLAGRSFVEQPRSLSAQYQEFFRQQVMRVCEQRGIPAHDLATGLRRDFQASKARLFHPNDGHLTPAGHAAVARAILELPADIRGR